MIVIGDVCGKGPEAATVGGFVRSLLRGAASQTTDVVALVELINRELLVHPANRFVTMVLAHVEPASNGAWRVRVAVAGHEPPVVTHGNGEAQPLTIRGQLLGFLEHPLLSCVELEFAAEDGLVFWTDGLSEIGERGLRPMIDVAAELTSAKAQSAAEMVTVIEDCAPLLDADVGPLADDVAIVVVRAVKTSPRAAAPRPHGDVPSDDRLVGKVEAEVRARNERVTEGRPEGNDLIRVLCECGYPTAAQRWSSRARTTSVSAVGTARS